MRRLVDGGGESSQCKPSVYSSLFPFQSYPCTLSKNAEPPGFLGQEHEGEDLCPVLGPEATTPQSSQWVRTVIVIVENISVCLHHAVLLLLGCSLYPLSTGTSSSFLTHIPSPHQSNWAPTHSASIHSIFKFYIHGPSPL